MTDDMQKKLFARNLNRLLAEKNLMQIDFAKSIGVKPSTLNTWCTGQAIPRTGTLKKITSYFNISTSDLMDEKPHERIPNVPILGEVACGLPMFAEQNIIGYTYTDKKDGVDFALYAHGDSMTAARIVDGDLVYIRQQSAVDNGEIALVLVDNDTATIKRFYDYGDKVVLRPESFNPEHKEQVYIKAEHTISIQGKVVFIKSYVK